MKFPFKNLQKKKYNDNQNPYLDRSQGKRVWNDRYLNLTQARKHWQWVSCGLFGINFILLCLVIKLSTQSSIKPFVVELSKGMPIGIASPQAGLPQSEQLIQFAINEYITHARTILNDGGAQKTLLDKTYAYSAGDTLNFLREYYTHHNPFEKAETASVEVSILNSLKIGAHTWQVTWDEVERSKEGGNIISASRYLGTFSVQQSEPDPKFMQINPFGIYITSLSWAKIQSQS